MNYNVLTEVTTKNKITFVSEGLGLPAIYKLFTIQIDIDKGQY